MIAGEHVELSRPRRLRAAYYLLLVYQVLATLEDTATATVGLVFWNDPGKADLDISRAVLVLTVVAGVLFVRS